MHQNAQVATNKRDELTLMCDELSPDVLVVTEHGFNNSNINYFQIQNFLLTNSHCRNSSKGGGVAIFSKSNYRTAPYRLTESIDKDFEVTGVQVATNKSQLTIIGLYRSPSGNYESFLSKFEQMLSEVLKKINNSSSWGTSTLTCWMLIAL